MNSRRLTALLIILGCLAMALGVAWKLGQPSPDDVTVEPVWFDKPLILPGELPFPPSSDMHAVLSVLQRTIHARSWEEYAACYTSATVPTLSYSNKDGITRFGRAGWEMATERHRQQFTVLGAILIAAKGQRYAFFYVIPTAITKLEPGQKMILTFVAVKDASRGWLLDRTLIKRSTLHLLSLDRPLDYICYGKKQEFARLIPQIKDSYRREFIDGQSGFYHFPANPQESGWIEWYPKEPKSAGGQPKAESP